MIIGRNRTMPNQIDCRTKIGRPKGSSREVSVTTIDMSAGMSPRVESCDVCIVGAGLAGLNALFVASRYCHATSGSSWWTAGVASAACGSTPTPTCGCISRTACSPPATSSGLSAGTPYLATKGEVLDHFDHCLNVIKQRVRVDEYFGWTLESHDEADGICGSPAGPRTASVW